jgi:RNA polymerase sigma-70 factor (ECF subfamily)
MMAGSAKGVKGWLTDARAGSPEALGELMEACRRYLLLVAQRELDPALRAKGGASDLVQETFLDAQRGFSGFRGDSETELLAWLRRLLLNNLISFARLYRETDKRQIGKEVGLGNGDSARCEWGGLAEESLSPSRQMMKHEEAESIRRGLDRLPADYRQVLLLRYQEEQSFEEIGRTMGRSANAVRKLWLRAIKRLQDESEGPT